VKYGLWYYKHTHNIGDDVWAYAQSLFYPRIDYLIDNTEVYKFKSDDDEEVATIVAAFVEPYNREYTFMPPANLIPLFVSSYFRPTMWEFLQQDAIRAYMKAFEPIGCRTREQANLFKEMGIDAYFSGCISLTLPNLHKPKDRYICCVDVPDHVVEYVKRKVGDRFEIRVMTHDVPNVEEHANMSIEERFDIVRNCIEIYASAHCVITSRLHAALPCLTQDTPVLLATTRERSVGVNDMESRLKDFFPLVHHCYYDDFLLDQVDYDFVHPPCNSDDYLVYKEILEKRCKDFIRDCEQGRVTRKAPFTERQRAEAMIEILQRKVVQLKQVIDAKNAKIRNQKEHILQVQDRLLKHESFNVWEGVEYFGNWEGRSKAMSKYISPDCRSLVDLGCGEMHIRRYLNPTIQYYGCDYKKRDDETIVCDLATGEFPDVHADTIFIAGVLEYLVNWKDVLKKSAEYCSQIVMSYSTTEAAPVRDSIWVTSIAEAEITDHMDQLGFRLMDREVYNTSVIFNFMKKMEANE